MEITSSLLPSVIQQATSLESSFYLLFKYVFDRQATFNQLAAEEDRLNIFDLQFSTVESQSIVTMTIEGLEVELDDEGHITPIDIGLSDPDYVPGTTSHPWNKATSLECLVYLWLRYLSIEKQLIYNPDENEPIEVSIEANTDFNAPLMTLGGTAVLPVIDVSQGENVSYIADEYLVGESLW